MPPRSLVEQLPEEIRRALDERLIGCAYSGYEGLSAWLEERGYVIKKSALANYGKKLQEMQLAAEAKLQTVRAATDAAMLLAKELNDDEAQLSSAVISMIQSDMFHVMVNLQEAHKEGDPMQRMKLLSKAARAAADAGRASVSLKKFSAEVRQKIDSKLAKLENDAMAGSGGGKRSLDAETLRIVRQEVYGIV